MASDGHGDLAHVGRGMHMLVPIILNLVPKRLRGWAGFTLVPALPVKLDCMCIIIAEESHNKMI